MAPISKTPKLTPNKMPPGRPCGVILCQIKSRRPHRFLSGQMVTQIIVAWSNGQDWSCQDLHWPCLFLLISGFSIKIIKNPTQTSSLIFAYIVSGLLGKRRTHVRLAFLQRGLEGAYVRIERFFLTYPCLSRSVADPRVLPSRRRRSSLLWIVDGR